MFASGSAGNVAQPNNIQRILIAVSVTMAVLGLLLEYLSIFSNGWMGNSLDEPGYASSEGLWGCHGQTSSLIFGFNWRHKYEEWFEKPFPALHEEELCWLNAVKAMLFIGIIHATAGMFLKMTYMINNDNNQGWMMVIGGIMSLLAGVFVFVGVTIYGTNTSELRAAFDEFMEKARDKDFDLKPYKFKVEVEDGEDYEAEFEDGFVIGLGWPFILSILAGLLFIVDGAVAVGVFVLGKVNR